MKRTLLLLRHGKSDWSTAAPDDYSRPLKRRGVKASKQMGRWLDTNKLRPQTVVSSGALRARTTAALVMRRLALDTGTLVLDDRIYEAAPANLLEVCREYGEDAQVMMLVGHNPGLELLADALSKAPLEPATNGKLMPTAALAVFRFEGAWRALDRGVAQESYVVRPRELPTV